MRETALVCVPRQHPYLGLLQLCRCVDKAPEFSISPQRLVGHALPILAQMAIVESQNGLTHTLSDLTVRVWGVGWGDGAMINVHWQLVGGHMLVLAAAHGAVAGCDCLTSWAGRAAPKNLKCALRGWPRVAGMGRSPTRVRRMSGCCCMSAGVMARLTVVPAKVISCAAWRLCRSLAAASASPPQCTPSSHAAAAPRVKLVGPLPLLGPSGAHRISSHSCSRLVGIPPAFGCRIAESTTAKGLEWLDGWDDVRLFTSELSKGSKEDFEPGPFGLEQRNGWVFGKVEPRQDFQRVQIRCIWRSGGGLCLYSDAEMLQDKGSCFGTAARAQFSMMELHPGNPAI